MCTYTCAYMCTCTVHKGSMCIYIYYTGCIDCGCTNRAMEQTNTVNSSTLLALLFETKSTNLIPKLNETWAGLISCLSTLIKLGE